VSNPSAPGRISRFGIIEGGGCVAITSGEALGGG